MRFLFILSAVLALQSGAFGQCQNGQCQRPAQYQTLTPRVTPGAYSGCNCSGGCGCTSGDPRQSYYVCPTAMPNGGTCALSGQTTPGQTCANGQCQRPSAAQYQTFTPRVVQAAPTFAPACQPAAPERQGLLARIQERREERKAARAAR